MLKTIIVGPTPEHRYMKRMGFSGAQVINGAVPNGQLPRVIGSGIFGCEGQNEGIFDGPSTPYHQPTGIFFDDTARDNYEVQQPDLAWSLLRRPGVPLYPGSSSYGTVLVGPSMGTNGDGTTTAPQLVATGMSWTTIFALATFAGVGLWFLTRASDEE